jgi:hypothetical protein
MLLNVDIVCDEFARYGSERAQLTARYSDWLIKEKG